MFKATKEATTESSVNYLNKPYCGPAEVTNIELKEIAGSDNNFVVTFSLLGEDSEGKQVTGSIYNRTEWAPTADTADDKVQNAIGRIAYFAAKFVPEEEVLAVEGQNWRDYCSKIMQLLQKHEVTGKGANIKVIGNVYNGKARVGSPKYAGWIYTDGTMPSFSNKELEANREYIEAKNAAPSEAAASNIPNADFGDAGF